MPPARPTLLPTLPHRPLLSLSAILLFLSGCANPGQPRPPSLHIPAPAKDLKAARIGDRVHLSWTVPAETTDRQILRGVTSAAVCRDVAPLRHLPLECHRVATLPVTPGAAEVDDPLPAGLLAGPPRLLVYRVELSNGAGRAMPPSAPAYTAAGPAPQPMGPLHVTAEEHGALIRWTPTNDPAPVELERTLVAAPPHQAAAAPNAGGKAAAPPSPFAQKAASATAILRVDPANTPSQTPKTAADSGGLLDPRVERLATYRYVAQRVLSVSLPAPAFAPGALVTVELRGLPSPPATFIDRDTLPPRPPAGLALIGNPGDPTQPTTNPPSVDLSWEPGLEDDLLGYNVYRSLAAAGPFQRLNSAPLPAPAFRDLEVRPGQTFFYRITAVDRSGNESRPSPAQPGSVPRP